MSKVDPSVSVPSAERPFWDRGWVWALIACATVLPFLGAPLLPFNDLPNHVGRHAVFLATEDTFFRRFYSVHWVLAGNLGVDCIVRVLGPLLGVERATWVAVAAIPPLTVIGLFGIARGTAGRIQPAALLATPLAINWALLTGFTNFCLSAAIALNVLAFWMRLRGTGFARRFLIFAPLGFITWLAHTAGWGLLGLGVLAFEVERAWRAPDRWRAVVLAPVQTLPFAVMFLPIVLWRHAAGNGAAVNSSGHWLSSKGASLISLFREQWFGWDVFSTLFFFGLCLAFFAVGRRVLRSAAALALAFLVAFALCPEEVFKSGFADRRLLAYGAMLAPLAIGMAPAPVAGRRARAAAALATTALLFLAARIAVSTVLWSRASRAQEARLALADAIPPDSRIFGLVVEGCDKRWARIGRPDHIQQYAIVRRHSMVNGMFQNPGLNQVQAVYARDGGSFDLNMLSVVHDQSCPVSYETETFQGALRNVPRSMFDYMWLIGEQPLGTYNGSGLTLVASRGNDRIYRIDHRS